MKSKRKFKNTLRQMTFHPKAAEYTFFSSTHTTFSILGHKSSLGKFKKIEIISSIFSNHNTKRLEITTGKKPCKTHKHVEAKHMLLNNQQVTENIKEEIKKYLETNDNENMTIQNLWDTAKEVLRVKFIAIQSYLRK